MSRLTGMSIADIERDRVNVARRFADEYGVVLLLKGREHGNSRRGQA